MDVTPTAQELQTMQVNPQSSIDHSNHAQRSSTLGPTGLTRIRQPISRPGSSGGIQTRSTSMGNLNSHAAPSSTPYSIPSCPPSPTLGFGEDLSRFTSESLHSFSFKNQGDNSLHSRHAVLRRSVDFMRDRQGWATNGLGIVNAQAKVSGDAELQSMVDLLTRASAQSGKDGGPGGLAFPLGPLTGPAESSGNVFEKTFTREQNQASVEGDDKGSNVEPPHVLKSVTITFAEPENSEPHRASIVSGSAPARRMPLKRTYTDVSSLSLQNQLTDLLSQPYLDNNTLSWSSTSSRPTVGQLSIPGMTHHAHGRAGPSSQAIFTTQGQAPWTINAANDMACLVFGVTKAELHKIGILDVVREDKRKWLEIRLRGPAERPTTTVTAPSSPRKSSPSPTTSVLTGGRGLTAKLLSKPPSRETGMAQRGAMARRTKSIDSGGDEERQSAKAAIQAPKSRGVILCGDVLQILKRDGSEGSATLWVQEKRGILIWVMEEVVEDLAYLSTDEVGCIAEVVGQSEAIWGMQRVRRGMDITRLLPDIPRRKDTNTGALDFDRIASIRRFTARTVNDISVPVTVDQLSGEQTFRVSSFPHIAGMLVLSASTLKVTSSNAAVAEALFGLQPRGLPMTELVPGFDKMLNLLVEEDEIQLREGMVIPEHSFRRARAMLALREGKADAAAVFLRPSGVPARHRDGSEIMVDVQMRVVKSETLGPGFGDSVIEEESEFNFHSSEIVYALWVTYSRAMHAVNHGIGPVSPLVSRPGTPPNSIPLQPGPGPSVTDFRSDSESDDSKVVLDPQLHSDVHSQRQVPEPATLRSIKTEHKKTIDDFVILEDMGAGAYGQVKLARPRHSPSSPKVVIKYVTKRRILVDTWTRDRRLGTVPLEIHVLDYLRRDGFRHPNIVEMSGFFEDDVNYYIEMVPHGLPGMDLFDYIELRVNMDEDECRKIFVQVASAVEFLHAKAKVVHRDIKDENVILDGEGNIKLIDFGSAAYIKNGPFDVFVGTIGTSRRFSFFLSIYHPYLFSPLLMQPTTTDYAAPEVLAGASYRGKEQDVWALGILLYTILYKENPFYSIDEIMDHDLRVPHVVSEPSIALVRAMLERDVDARVAIGGVVGSEWCRSG